MATWYFDNLLHWTGQVMAIASVGLLLPLILRVRHPRTQLLYCHFLLAAGLLLPLLQPWQHPLVLISNEALPASALGSILAGTPWRVLAFHGT